jgi:hypothetical protein
LPNMTGNNPSSRQVPNDGNRVKAHQTAVRLDSAQKGAFWLSGKGAGLSGSLPVRHQRGLVVSFLVLVAVFSAIPLTIDLLDKPNKDYSLWYQVGVVLRKGMEIYPDPATGRLFPFMYPPSAAAILGFVSLLGKHGTTLVLVLAHSMAWIGAVVLSVWLARGDTGGLAQQSLLLYGAPSLCIIPLIHNTYMLGQPNLALLTLLLAAFACLRLGRDASAGVLVATAAAIKAFPILALGYFVYRGRWRATIATGVWLFVWLLIVPLPFRTPAQAVSDLAIWSRGMIFTYNPHGIAQRPYRSFSYKNQSIMALAHRFLRDVPADGESVLSAQVTQRLNGQPSRGILADGAIDLAAMLTVPTSTPPWDDRYEGLEAAMKRAWRVNVAALTFRTVTAITLASMLMIALFVVAVLPPRRVRSASTDAAEFALVTLLIVIFSPLSFNYAFVWLIYPLTVGLNLTLNNPATGYWRKLEIAWIVSVLLIPAIAIVTPIYAQAYGNLFVPALLLVIGLGVKLRGMSRGAVTANDTTAKQPPFRAASVGSGSRAS